MHVLALGVKQALLLFFRLCLRFEPLTHALIPRDHVLVGLGRKAATRENFGKWLARRRVAYVPLLDGFGQEAAVLLRAEEELDGLPHDPAFGLERRYGWVGEGGGCICRSSGDRLERVQTAQALVDEGDALIWGYEEKLVVVAVQFTVKSSQLRGQQVGLVRRGICAGDNILETAQEAFQLVRACLVCFEQVTPVFICLPLFHHPLVRVRGLRRHLCRRGSRCRCRGGVHDTLLVVTCELTVEELEMLIMLFNSGMLFIVAAGGGGNNIEADPEKE